MARVIQRLARRWSALHGARVFEGSSRDEALADSIVLDGALTDKGMVSFKSALSKEDVNAIRAYVVERARYMKHGPGGLGAFMRQRGAGRGRADAAQPQASH